MYLHILQDIQHNYFILFSTINHYIHMKIQFLIKLEIEISYENIECKFIKF